MAQTRTMVVEIVRNGSILRILEGTASRTGSVVIGTRLGPSLLMWVSCLAQALFLLQSNLSGHPGGSPLQYFQNHSSLHPR